MSSDHDATIRPAAIDVEHHPEAHRPLQIPFLDAMFSPEEARALANNLDLRLREEYGLPWGRPFKGGLSVRSIAELEAVLEDQRRTYAEHDEFTDEKLRGYTQGTHDAVFNLLSHYATVECCDSPTWMAFKDGSWGCRNCNKKLDFEEIRADD